MITTNTTTKYSAIGAVSAQLNLPMANGHFYLFSTNTGCFIAQGANPTAAAADGSRYVGPNETVLLDGGYGAKLAVIQDTAGGKCTLCQIYFTER